LINSKQKSKDNLITPQAWLGAFFFLGIFEKKVMLLFISGAEIVFIFFVILLVFGADKIPSIARGLAKGMTQIRQATDEIKSEIQKSVDDVDDSQGKLGQNLTKEVKDIKKDFDDLTDSIKRKF
jgi:sec-independent protein translocase protein TatA